MRRIREVGREVPVGMIRELLCGVFEWCVEKVRERV